MGYSIKNIEELDTFSFEGTKCKKETVRKSLDGTQFIVEGDNINDFTHAQILEYLSVNRDKWEKPFNNLF